MKLLMVTHYFADHRGGIEIVAGELAHHLTQVDKDLHMTWVASGATQSEDTAEIQHVGIPVWNITENRLGVPYPIWSPVGLWRLLAFIREADMLLLHDAIYMGSVFSVLFARLLRKPVLVVQHISEVPYERVFLRTAMRLANALLVGPVLRAADQVVFISEKTARFFQERIRFRVPPKVIYNGLDTACYYPATPQSLKKARHDLCLEDEAPVCLFVGRFVEKKGLPFIRQLAAATPDVTWILAGWGPIDPMTWGLSNVRVESQRRKASLVELYHAADLMVLPSIGEGFPLVIQESLACGLPVLTSEDTARGDPGAAAFLYALPLEGEDVVSTWTHQIQSLLDGGLAGFPHQQVKAYVHQQWSWAGVRERYHHIITSLLNDA